MDEINKFIDEIRTIDIDFDHNSASRKIIALSELTKYKDESTYEGYNYIYLYDIIHRSKNDLKEAYNNALLSLNHLSKKEILNAAIQVTNYCLGDILKLVSNCNRDYISNKLEDRQRSKLIKTIRKLSFDNISSDHLSIMSQCYLSYEFFHKLIDELTDKNIYQIKLMKDIRVILNGIIKSEKKENPHSPLIYEKSILRLLTEKIRIHDGIEESMLSETGKDKLNVSASAAVNNVEILNKSDKEENNGTTPHIKTLFSFIDFLHANIENFNQYDNVILELNKMFERFFQLGFHFEETIEKRALQEEIDVKWDIISDNIVTPIKDKVVELDLFDWSAPETLSNNHMPLVLRLSENCDDQDLDAILKAKNQYIEFTNKISPRVIKQAERMFKYLYDIMYEIAKNFEEEGDKPIKHEEVRRVETFEELVEGFNAGEKVSMPLLPSNFPQGGVKKEVNPESNIILKKGERKIMTEQQIFNKINELTTKEYEEKYYLDGYNESTLTTLNPEVIGITFSDIHSELDEAFKLIYLRGEIDFLKRIEKLLHTELKKLDGSYEDEKSLIGGDYENDSKEFTEHANSRVLIFETKIEYTKQLLDLLSSLINTIAHQDNFVAISNIPAPVLNELENVESELPLLNKQQNSKNDKYAHYTALQWGAIIHYTHEKELEIRREKVDDIISDFKKKHSIKLKESTLRSRYYEAAKKIKVTFDYKSILLEKTMPFFNEHYKHLAKTIQNEVEYLKENEEERIDNQ